MHPTPPSPERSADRVPAPRAQLLCPVCNGLLIPVRGACRCSRCYFSLCVGCEGESGYEQAEAGA